jgi:hypothetical protein
MQQAAKHLKISPMSVRRLIEKGIIKSKQVVPFAPRIIKLNDLKKPEVLKAAECIKRRMSVPLPESKNQVSLNF